MRWKLIPTFLWPFSRDGFEHSAGAFPPYPQPRACPSSFHPTILLSPSASTDVVPLRYKAKKRKEEAKRRKEAEEKEAAAAAAAAAKEKADKEKGKKGGQSSKEKDPDPDGAALAATEDPLREASKLVVELKVAAKGFQGIHVCFLARAASRRDSCQIAGD